MANYKYVIINSFDRTGGAGDTDFYVTLNGTFREEFDQVGLVNCIMTNSFYNVDSTNNTFDFEEDAGGDVSATITAGNYSLGDMLTALKTAMEAVSPNTRTYTLTSSTITGKITITGSAGTFSVLTTGGLNLMLGFSRSTATGQNLANTAPRIYNFSRYSFLNLQCSACKSDTFNTINGGRQNILSFIPVTESSNGDILSFRPNDINWVDISDRTSTDQIAIRLTDDNNNIIDLNGGYLSLYLAFR